MVRDARPCLRGPSLIADPSPPFGQDGQEQQYPARPLRSHSSISSFASNTSHTSDLSQQGWSSVASGRSSETEPDTFGQRRVSPSSHGAAVNLSIDPKLFQAKSGVDDRLVTARPRLGKVPKTPKVSTAAVSDGAAAMGREGKGAKEKKKVSHARKVSRGVRLCVTVLRAATPGTYSPPAQCLHPVPKTCGRFEAHPPEC
jgi:hypothetical protein